MEAVFNTPVAAARIEQALLVSPLGFETGNPIDGFGGEFVADQMRRFAANGADLLGVGESTYPFKSVLVQMCRTSSRPWPLSTVVC